MVDLTMLQELLEKEKNKSKELEGELQSLQNRVKTGKKLIIAIMIMIAVFVAVLCIIFKCMDTQIPYIYSTTIEIGLVVEVILLGIWYYF